MEKILSAAKKAVEQAKSMITYYEKEVASKKEYLDKAIKEAEELEQEYNELIKIVSAPTQNIPQAESDL